jgi:hypothetical protein
MDGMEMNAEKTKVTKISRQTFSVKLMIDQNNWRMRNFYNT